MQAMREDVRAAVDACHWMVLPVSENPTGAAQGALAMEVADGCDPGIVAFIEGLNDEVTFAEATREREILRSYGGGCHQKIGVTVLTRATGTLLSLRGVTDDGRRLDSPPWPDHESWTARADGFTWTSGLTVWRRLAEQGQWVNGSAEGLGEDEDPRVDVIAGRLEALVR